MSPAVLEEIDRGLFLLPPHLREGMRRYFVERVPTGSFLRAALENDLRGAIGKADPAGAEAIPHIVQFLYHHAPPEAHGSAAAVAAWLAPAEGGRV